MDQLQERLQAMRSKWAIDSEDSQQAMQALERQVMQQGQGTTTGEQAIEELRSGLGLLDREMRTMLYLAASNNRDALENLRRMLVDIEDRLQQGSRHKQWTTDTVCKLAGKVHKLEQPRATPSLLVDSSSPPSVPTATPTVSSSSPPLNMDPRGKLRGHCRQCGEDECEEYREAQRPG